MVEAEQFESVSTWKQHTPTPLSAERTNLLRRIAREICGVSDARLRVAIDGRTASGKTSFAHELAAEIRVLGRPTARASLDDFKKPWRDAREKGYDRVSGEGYYRNAPDFDSARELLLEPAGPRGSGILVLCAHDPLTGADHRGTTVAVPDDAVLIVDSVFCFRPEYDEFWEFRIWIDISAQLSIDRGVARDAATEGKEEAERLHKGRYHVAEAIYGAEVGPRGRADLVIDNADFASPRIIAPRLPSPGDLDPEQAFVRFDRQDSGCLSFGIESHGQSWFVKRATSNDGRSSLRRAIEIHAAVKHQAIVPLERSSDGEALTLLYPWKDGVVLNHATSDGENRAGLARFQKLPVAEVRTALSSILEAHQTIAHAGFVSVDLYDGCFLYDFAESRMWLIDLDEYRPGPFILHQERLPGSLRYMAPEELIRGSTIDERTTVFVLGRVIWHLLDSEFGWRGSRTQRDLVEAATKADPGERLQSVDALADAWRASSK